MANLECRKAVGKMMKNNAGKILLMMIFGGLSLMCFWLYFITTDFRSPEEFAHDAQVDAEKQCEKAHSEWKIAKHQEQRECLARNKERNILAGSQYSKKGYPDAENCDVFFHSPHWDCDLSIQHTLSKK